MSEEPDLVRSNVEIVRSIHAEGLLDSPAAHDALSNADVEYVNPREAIESGLRRGQHEVREALRGLTDAFEHSEHRLKRVFDAGDAVVAEVAFHGRGATSGADVTQDEAHTWTYQQGRLVRFEWGQDLAAALEAVGLQE